MAIESRGSRRNGLARLVIVDDHELVRAGLRGLLDDEPDLEVVGEATNGRQALAVCRRLQPDLVLLDLRLPELDGLEVTEALKREHPGMVVLVLSLYEDPESVLRVIQAGAAGYLLKDAPLEHVMDGIRAALAGELVLDMRLARRLLRRTAGDPREQAPRPGTLTGRECEVLQLVAQGRTNQEIGFQLCLSRSTVKTHIEHIIAKLGATDRTQAAVLAAGLGLLDAPRAS